MRPLTVTLAIIVSTAVLAETTLPDGVLGPLASAAGDLAAAARGGIDAVDPAVRESLEPALAAWIDDSRDAAVALGVERIPPEMRAALQGHVPHEILERVRWRVDDTRLTVQQSLFQMGYAPAITLDDVILFASPADATDPKLWAHELYHVIQYRDWGVDGFAARYLADHAAVERDAWEFRWQFMKATDRIPPPSAASSAP